MSSLLINRSQDEADHFSPTSPGRRKAADSYGEFAGPITPRLNRGLSFGLVIGPVSFYLFGPVSVTFPGIKRRIHTCAATARHGGFGNPAAILLPAVGICWLCRLFASITIVCTDIVVRVGAVVAGPGVFFAILHLFMPVQSFSEMLRVSTAGSQELHHNAKRHIPHIIQ